MQVRPSQTPTPTSSLAAILEAARTAANKAHKAFVLRDLRDRQEHTQQERQHMKEQGNYRCNKRETLSHPASRGEETGGLERVSDLP